MLWTAVLPLAALTAAKSRLRNASEDETAHRQLVTALRADTAAALRSTAAIARVVAVSPDQECLAWAATEGFLALPEVTPGLNEALRFAAEYAAGQWPGDGVLAIVGDLPAATGGALDAVLSSLGPGERGFVRDHDGTGTTLLAAAPGVALEPLFGAGSAQRHLASGATPLPAADALSWDVDTPADLQAVLALPQLGIRTRAVRAR